MEFWRGTPHVPRRLEAGFGAGVREQAQADSQIAGDRRSCAGVYYACREVPVLPGFI